MEILFENYVTFIDGGTSDGVGFFVGNFFITAGHVFNEGQTHSIYVNGQRIVLDKRLYSSIFRMEIFSLRIYLM